LKTYKTQSLQHITHNNLSPAGVRLTNAHFKTYTMANRLKTKEDKQLEHYAAMQKQYTKESLSMVWFFIIMGAALLLTALIENI
jgi:hypothetical protein